MSIDDLLNRMDGVRKNGANHWIAKCPAHTDKYPSLSIACGEDGRILLHDFGGCKVHDVLAAVGLEVGDLFERRMKPQTRAQRAAAMEGFQRHSWEAALRIASTSMLTVQVAADMVQRGEPLSERDRQILATACGRIEDARTMLAKGGDVARDLRRLSGRGIKETPR